MKEIDEQNDESFTTKVLGMQNDQK